MTNTTTTTIIDIVKLNKVDFIKGNKGSFRVVSKCKAGFMTVVEFNEVVNEGFSKEPSQVLGWFKKGAIQTVEFKAEGSNFWITVFARVGKKIKLIDQDMLKGLNVGVINSFWINTELYSQYQYQAVNAKTWDSMAFVMNEEKVELV